MVIKSRRSSETPRRQPSGVSLHATRAALTTSRVITSHVRKRYEERYRGRHRFARLVFGFDLTLLAIAAGLIIANIIFVVRPFTFQRPAIDLTIRAHEFVAGNPQPIEAVVRVADAAVHEDVSLTWHLPPWVEILRADPPLGADGTVLFGRIAPGQEIRSLLYVHMRAVPGAPVPLRFTLREHRDGKLQTLIGGETRPIAKSILTAEPAIEAGAVESGGSIPLRVKNAGTVDAPAVIVRLLSSEGAPSARLGENGEVRIGRMLPGEERVVFIDVGPDASGPLTFIWEVQDVSKPLWRQAYEIGTADSVGVRIQEPLQSSSDATAARVAYDASAPAGVWVYHPSLLTDGGAFDQSFDISSGSGELQIPLRAGRQAHATNWFAIPFERRAGSVVLGSRASGVLSSSLPFQAGARYYAESGDQLGVGPLPPRVGEPTSFWIVWSIGPTHAALSDLVMSAPLGSGVVATGKFASHVPGSFSAEGAEVRWNVPSLEATGARPATFAFEVIATPSESQRGIIPVLVGESSAEATEVNSGARLNATFESLNTNLVGDVLGRGRGRVE